VRENPHAGCDVAGAGNGFTVGLLRLSQRKRGETARLDLRNTAPVLDPTGLSEVIAPPEHFNDRVLGGCAIHFDERIGDLATTENEP
jgi:hypothetical protein